MKVHLELIKTKRSKQALFRGIWKMRKTTKFSKPMSSTWITKKVMGWYAWNHMMMRFLQLVKVLSVKILMLLSLIEVTSKVSELSWTTTPPLIRTRTWLILKEHEWRCRQRKRMETFYSSDRKYLVMRVNLCHSRFWVGLTLFWHLRQTKWHYLPTKRKSDKCICRRMDWARTVCPSILFPDYTMN